jgi:hypothetical protein
MTHSIRTFLIDGERRRVAFVTDLAAPIDDGDLAFAYGLGEGTQTLPPGWTSLGVSPFLERPLGLAHFSERLPNVPLLAPFGGKPQPGFREIFVTEPRYGRLWGRFSVDVPVAIERAARLFDEGLFRRIAEGPSETAEYRVFIMEDGDRYAVRATCAFTVRDGVGTIVEVLHDRSLDGLRHASHLIGLALRAMSDAGARVARAAALPHSGTIPVFLRHAFRRPRGASLVVRPIDAAVRDVITRRESWYVSYVDFIDELGAPRRPTDH